MLTPFKLMGIFGGTFDPIHNGHLQVAHSLLQVLPMLDQIQFIPCHRPAHRDQPSASSQQRLHMLQLATADNDHFKVNDIELRRAGPSYMVDTLAILHQQFPQHALALIIGSDVLLTLNQWHHWQQLLQFAHFIVVNRPDYQLEPHAWLTDLLLQHSCVDAKQLVQQRQGYIIQQTIKSLAVSATVIRQQLSAGESINDLVPSAIAAYIEKHHLYIRQEFSSY